MDCKTKKQVLIDLLFSGSPNWARTSDIMINSHALYRLSYGGITAKHPIGCLACVGVFLFFQIVTNQVSSALLSLTSVFGMGTGGPSASSTPTLYGSLSPYILNILFFLVTRAGIEPALPA